MPALDLTGVGGWFGAQNSLKDILAQTAARGAQERNALETEMAFGLKDRAQLADEDRVRISAQKQALEELQNEQLAPQRTANVRQTNALAGNAETLDVRDIAGDARRESAAMKLALLKDQFDEKNNLALRVWNSQENELDRKSRMALERASSGSAFRRPMLFAGLDGSPYLIDPVSGQGRAATDAGGQPLLGKATMGQQDAKKYYDRNKIALDMMNDVEWKLTPEDIAIISVKPMVKTPIGTSIANTALSSNGKLYATALAQFMESYLRDDSGKLITPEEYANGARMYGRTVGDNSADEPVSRFKRAGRQAISEGLLTTSGPYRALTLQQQGAGGGGQTPPPAAAAQEPVTGEWYRDPQTNKLVRRNPR